MKGLLSKKFAEKLKKARKLAGILLISSFLMQISFGVIGINAVSTNPRGEDAPSLDGELAVGNVTVGDTTYKDSVEALVDDVVKFEMAYHNTQAPDSGIVAHDVVVKITLPGEANTNLIANGFVAGKDTNTVTDIAAVLTKVPANLEYVKGSAKWRHNIGTAENPNWVTKSISDNVVTTGVNIGDVESCWEFQGTVTVLARVKASSLKVEKKVGNLGSSWVKENSAKPGEKLSYLISYTNMGNTDLTNVVVGDNLPPYMTYVSGSTTMITGTYPNGVPVPDGVTTGGIKVGTYKPGSGGHIKFQVVVNNNIPVGEHVLKNIGIAKADQTLEVWDSAKTTVKVEGLKPTQEPKFVKSKSAFNESKKFDATKVLANAGNEIVYTLTTKNVGDGSSSIEIKDNISDVLQYADIKNLRNGTLSNGVLNFGSVNLSAGQSVNKTFTVKVKPFLEWPDKGDLTMTNNYGNEVNVKLGFYKIEKSKTAFNNTQSLDATTKKAVSGDNITYTLVTGNMGNDAVSGVVVSDNIADVLEYADVIDAKGGVISDGVITWSSVELNPGAAIKNEFIVKVKDPVPTNPQKGKSFDLKMENEYGNNVVIDIGLPLKPQILGAQVQRLAAAGVNSILLITLTMFMFASSIFLYFREKMLLSNALRK